MRKQNADWSTINLEELQKLPVYDWAGKGYRLQEDMGNGCVGDPPGFPTYFTQSVYTAQGNSPIRGYAMVIVHDDRAYGIEPANWEQGDTWEVVTAKRDALMLRLWKPLPLEHPRTQEWIKATFKHHHSCYQVPELRAQGKNWSDSMLVWPGGTLGKTPFGTLQDPAWEVEYAKKHQAFDKWTDMEKGKFIRDIEANNKRVERFCGAVAIPENHSGTILVRQYYPDFQPTAALIAGEFTDGGRWWETLAECLKPDRCPGQYGHAHPVNGSWCQFCGWSA